LTSKTKSKNFQWLELFLYYSLLWVPDIYPKFLIYATHIKNVIAELFSLF